MVAYFSPTIKKKKKLATQKHAFQKMSTYRMTRKMASKWQVKKKIKEEGNEGQSQGYVQSQND